ncbi:MAG: tetratricopeptide repeat protein [Saprospiraceae bacterium]|nr:tetratricopeptide repeat protein [Bacteroidia bacterium]NNE16720.1 tetratricopeptide repeat protein [Saprospiraceae bacterium]NNL90829.1 tetratricopeptide repeat protein [Saprospiraceae bacterium]
MGLQKTQIISVVIFIGLFGILYFGCDTKTKEHKAVEKSRAQNIELISPERLIAEARTQLTVNGKSDLFMLDEELKEADSDSSKVKTYKALASLWYAEQYPLISGYYANKVAEIEESSEEAWSIAGTTYAIAAQRVSDENEKKHAILKSRSAFENVLSLNSENVDSKINLALSYVEMPEEGNPMKGILMLIDLNKKYPDNISVLLNLGRLALGTNQLDKSVERLSRVVSIDPNNTEAHCLLAEVYRKKGDLEKASLEQQMCDLK